MNEIIYSEIILFSVTPQMTRKSTDFLYKARSCIETKLLYFVYRMFSRNQIGYFSASVKIPTYKRWEGTIH